MRGIAYDWNEQHPPVALRLPHPYLLLACRLYWTPRHTFKRGAHPCSNRVCVFAYAPP